uniref:protein FAM45A n=1 Tax=Ciona intestinalis TaxID=7719 RepID=UPI00006A5A5D|nr:protein FAM45A [Ciona intestinalis]|eukprot:XP_018668351.1 protein FAM45A [Ciona intestinalis]
MELTSLRAVGIVEKDQDNGLMWTWTYPSLTQDEKQYALSKCCLSWNEKPDASKIIPFVFSHYMKQWYYIFTAAPSEPTPLKSVAYFSIVLLASDFNPEKYAVLTRILSKFYEESGNPVRILEQYLMIVTKGLCHSNSNGVFKVQSFSQEKAYTAASLKDVINVFEIQSIILYTAILLKKKVLVYHNKLELLLEITRALPAFVWHRQDWNCLYPWVHDKEQELTALLKLPHFIVGTTEEDLLKQEDYDIYANVPAKTITVSPHAKESLTMGKLHKDIAKKMLEICENESSSNKQLIMGIDEKTTELLDKLRSLGSETGAGKTIIKPEDVRSKNFHTTTTGFLINLAISEQLLEFD